MVCAKRSKIHATPTNTAQGPLGILLRRQRRHHHHHRQRDFLASDATKRGEFANLDLHQWRWCCCSLCKPCFCPSGEDDDDGRAGGLHQQAKHSEEQGENTANKKVFSVLIFTNLFAENQYFFVFGEYSYSPCLEKGGKGQHGNYDCTLRPC